MRPGLHLPPAALAVAALGVQRLVTAGDRPRSSPLRVTLAASASLGAVGLLAGSLAGFRFSRTTVDPRPTAAPSALVTDGVNAVSRNPMYVGMAGLLAGHAVTRGRRAWLPMAAFVVWMDRVQIPAEELVLRKTFGAQFEAYAAEVPRWLTR
jgi:protein-S-isoprenylcysteine O-methyltransferase Ste14